MWGSQTYGIKPDLVTCAKQLSSAYLPIAAVMMSERIFEGIVEGCKDMGVFGLGYTYGGHPVPAAVALETLRIYEERNILAHVRDIAPHFQERLRGLADHPLVGEVRGVGLIGGIELVADKETKESFPPGAQAGPTMGGQGFQHGLIVRPLPGDVIGVCPPMIIEAAEIDAMFDAFEKTLDSTLAVLKP